ncbi:hypothetical protein [Streptomyces sp. SP18CM02]|uniref:hypothetical protein n=1 Tax=Streptomyces sp. SP18CM02 TaxID=2758571 RepID=UPI00168BFE1A|nr:hypothetical protein [Streptomyces sp. SP18CM02]MBD3550808.1 hypothetical protein [Streptomyces sp. SP18CM02]
MLGDNTTEQRLRLLQAEFTQHERRGPGDGRTATRTTSPAPLNLNVLDRIHAAVTEVVEHTWAADWTRPAGPTPADASRVYAWAREHTAHLDAERQQARETLIYRQGLEHAIDLGDTTVVNQHPCPACGCWGLLWSAAANRAACINRYCVDDKGLSNTWPLATLAHHHIARQFARQSSAT